MNSPIENSKSAKQSGKVFADNQLVGVAKVANNYNDLVKGLSTRQKLWATPNHQIFASAGANYFREEVCRYKFRSLVC